MIAIKRICFENDPMVFYFIIGSATKNLSKNAGDPCHGFGSERLGTSDELGARQ